MPVIFNESYKHGRLEFFPGVSVAFEDPDAEPFFKKVGVAEATDLPPVKTYSQDEVSIDPETAFVDGTLVRNAREGDPTAAQRRGTVQPDDSTVVMEDGNG